MDPKLLDRVRKLLRLSDSPNENEAASAAAAAQRLITEHQLTAALLAYDEPATAQPDEPITDFHTLDAPLDARTRRPIWNWSLALTVARVNDCGVYRSGEMHIYGRPSDVENVRYLYAYLVREVERLIARNGKGCGPVWRNNYGRGIVDTITTKLAHERGALRADARAQAQAQDRETGTTTALVRVNTALARMEDHADAVRTFARETLKLRTTGSSSARHDGAARERGRRDGQSITWNGRAGLTSGTRALRGRP